MSIESDNSKKLNEFFNEEYQSLKAFVNSRIKASVSRDAEDIVQDVALKLFSGADRYSPINNVAGFVYNAIRNSIIDIMRSNKRASKPEEIYDLKLQELAEMIYEPPDDEYSNEMRVALKAAIMELKPRYRDIIMAVDFEGYTYNEISMETGIPKGTLMSNRHRAIAMLYKKLQTNKK